MNKAEMADRLTARTGLDKAVAREAVDGGFAAIGGALADGEEVRISGFGTFGTKSRPARIGRNPRTERQFRYRRRHHRRSRPGRR